LTEAEALRELYPTRNDLEWSSVEKAMATSRASGVNCWGRLLEEKGTRRRRRRREGGREGGGS